MHPRNSRYWPLGRSPEKPPTDVQPFSMGRDFGSNELAGGSAWSIFKPLMS